jgi:hypothetical protein
MAKKKDLAGAITRGADLFFSVNDEPQEAQPALDAVEPQEAHEVRTPRKAQEVPKEQLEATVHTMQEQIEAAEARRTQGRKGLKMPKMNMSFTPSNMEYLRVMAGVNGMTVTRFMNYIIEQHAATNAERYKKAKELMRDE